VHKCVWSFPRRNSMSRKLCRWLDVSLDLQLAVWLNRLTPNDAAVHIICIIGQKKRAALDDFWWWWNLYLCRNVVLTMFCSLQHQPSTLLWQLTCFTSFRNLGKPVRDISITILVYLIHYLSYTRWGAINTFANKSYIFIGIHTNCKLVRSLQYFGMPLR
jgi:hypothetical protein